MIETEAAEIAAESIKAVQEAPEQDYEQDYEQYELVREINDDDYIKKMGFFARLLSIIFSPFKLIKNIALYPVITPLVIVILLLSPLTGYLDYLNKNLNEQAQTLIMESAEGDMAEVMRQQMEAVMEANGYDTERAGRDILVNSATSFAGAIALPMITSLLYFLVCKILRGKAKYGQIFSFALHVQVLAILYNAGLEVFFYMTQTLLDPLSLVILHPDLKLITVEYTLFSAVSLLFVWAGVLRFKAFHEFNKFSYIKAAAVTAIGMAASLGTAYASVVFLQAVMSSLLGGA